MKQIFRTFPALLFLLYSTAIFANPNNLPNVVNTTPDPADFGTVVRCVSGCGGGDSSAANQVTANNYLASLVAALINPMPVAQSGSWSVVVSSVPLATNAANAANQSTEISSLASIKTDADSIVTNTSNTATSVATIATNSASQATAANQATANTSLASIKTDADSVVTNTSNTATSAATIATNSGTQATATKQDTGNNSLAALVAALTNPLPVSGTFWQATQPVSGTFWQATQPVSGTVAATKSGTWDITNAGTFAVQASESGTWNITNVSGTVSLPTGAATAAKQPALGTAGTPSSDVITVQGATSMTALKVDPSGVTSPVSAASLPLPSGAATTAKQPALGTAGSASPDVITVQGAASMTALKTDSSATTQPVSNAGTFAVQDTRLPAAFGQQAASASVGVALANEDVQDLYFTGQSAQTSTVNNIIPASAGASATDATGYRSGSAQIHCPAGTYTTGAITFEGSNDNSNFKTMTVIDTTNTNGTILNSAITLVTTTDIIYTFPLNFRYIRIRISTGVTGASASVQAYTRLSQMPWSPPVIQIAQAIAASLNATVNVANGQTAHSSASSGNPVRVGGRAKTTNDTTLVDGDASNLETTTDGSLIVYPNAAPELAWQYAAAASGISNTTTAVTIKAAAAAGIRNYIASCQLSSTALGVATEFAIRDGAAGTVIWRTSIPAAGILGGEDITFTQPIHGTAATLLEIVTLTASVTGNVYVNCQGFTAP